MTCFRPVRPGVGRLLENGVGHFPEKWVGNLAEKLGLKAGHFRENSQEAGSRLDSPLRQGYSVRL